MWQKYQICHEPTFVFSSLIKSESTRLCQKLKFNGKKKKKVSTFSFPLSLSLFFFFTKPSYCLVRSKEHFRCFQTKHTKYNGIYNRTDHVKLENYCIKFPSATIDSSQLITTIKLGRWPKNRANLCSLTQELALTVKMQREGREVKTDWQTDRQKIHKPQNTLTGVWKSDTPTASVTEKPPSWDQKWNRPHSY